MVLDTRETTALATTASLDIPSSHRISWGAVIAGISLLFALSWLMLILGSAIGVGVADASDLEAIGDGLAIGSIIWILLSVMAATFAGGLLSAKLAGTVDDRIGALHGLTVWSVGILLSIFIGASGIGGAFNAISGAVGSASSASSTAIAGAIDKADDSALPESVMTSLAAIVKRQASKVISDSASGTNTPSNDQVQGAIESLDAEDTGAITSALVSGNTQQARERLSARTSLSVAEIDSIIEGASEQAEEWSNSDNAEEAQQWLNEQINDVRDAVSQSVSDIAGPQVNAQEIDRAIADLDSDVLMQAGQYLVMGEPQMAKDVLAVNTRLSEEDINAIVNGAQQEAKKVINNAKKEFEEASEAIGTYTQAVLWSAFIAAALGMIAGLVGGHMGASTVRRIYAVR